MCLKKVLSDDVMEMEEGHVHLPGLGSPLGDTVYGTHEDSHIVMSEKVQSLAGSIYQEFERMIARYIYRNNLFLFTSFFQ